MKGADYLFQLHEDLIIPGDEADQRLIKDATVVQALQAIVRIILYELLDLIGYPSFKTFDDALSSIWNSKRLSIRYVA